jgi:hypothetical protein
MKYCVAIISRVFSPQPWVSKESRLNTMSYFRFLLIIQILMSRFKHVVGWGMTYWGDQSRSTTFWGLEIIAVGSRISASVSLNKVLSHIMNIQYYRWQILNRILQGNSAIQLHAILQFVNGIGFRPAPTSKVTHTIDVNGGKWDFREGKLIAVISIDAPSRNLTNCPKISAETADFTG